MTENLKRKGLVPDYYDDPNLRSCDHVILPSFKDIRRNTLQALYGIEDEQKDTAKINLDLLMDKSPKGSVDEGIRSLVDLVNAHPSYATLSSCSGRISLFDPNHGGDLDSTIKNHNETEVPGENLGDDGNGNTGKGYGSWLITSHATISSKYLIDVLDEHAKRNLDGYALIFKHEPLLLHIAACNMSRARQLLTIACNLGFRESGLVVTPKRITVAIRSHSLALAVPISSHGRLRPNNEYLDELVKEANDRFHLNEQKLVALEQEVMNQLFIMKEEKSKFITGQGAQNLSLTGTLLPDLNLWGHSAVCISSLENASDNNSEIIVFGGYGAGPIKSKESNYGCSRSDKVYSLKIRNSEGHSYAWQEVQKNENIDETEEETIHGMKLKPTTFTPREGHSSCILPLHKISDTMIDEGDCFIATFGGRASPARPKNDLVFTSSKRRPLQFYNPVDVRGDYPPACWGHTFIALSGNDGKIAVVVGGRDDKNVFDSIYVLNCVKTELDKNYCIYFMWERLEIAQSIPRFHHSSVLVESKSCVGTNEEKLIVFGGLASLSIFDDNVCDESRHKTCQIITLSENVEVDMKSLESESMLCFGASSCYFSNNTTNDSATDYLIKVGGLSTNGSISVNDFNVLDSGNFSDIPCDIDDDIDFGSMIHNVVLRIPNVENRFVSIGGGVPSFAFGQSFAKSYAFHIQKGKVLDKDIIIKHEANGANDQEMNKKTPFMKAKTPLMKANGGKSNITDVLYVLNRKAKELKQKLQSIDFLDRNYRMTKANKVSAKLDDASDMIAVPVTTSCLQFLSSQEEESSADWVPLIQGTGTQDMPFSTVVMGRK